MHDTILANETLPVNNESLRQPEIQDTGMPSGISHGFDTGYAIAYGVDEAIMIRNLQFFIISNANKGLNFHEERYWTYDRLEDFPNHFPYWTTKQCRRVITSLISQGVIISGDFNKRWSDRTCWYAFKDQSKFIRNIKPPKKGPLSEEKNPKEEINKESSTDLPKRANENCPNGQMTNDQMGKCIYSTSSIPDAIPSSSSLKVPDEPLPAKAGEMEDKTSSSEKPKRVKNDFTPRVREVGNQMINIIITHEPEYSPPKNLAPFLTEVDFLLRTDKREPEKVYDVLNWALSDSFWRDKMFKPNPAKYLREKFLQLKNKMEAKPTEPKKDRKFAPCSNDQNAIQKMEEMERRAL